MFGIVRSNQPDDGPRYTGLDVNSACTPTSTWEAQNNLLLQRDAIGDNCTNRTIQLQPQSARNSVCIPRACMTRTVSTFSILGWILAFAFALSLFLGRLTFRLLALSRALSFVLALPRLWLGLAILMARLLPFAGALSIPWSRSFA